MASSSLQACLARRASFLHVSAEARMVPHPLSANAPWIPWIQKPGRTYDIGRNAAKRARRAKQGVRK
jgi:hypothetical protein